MSSEVSVVVPTRNKAAVLQDTLSALLVQGMESDSFEVIVVDNGSSDETSQVVQTFLAQRPHWQLIHEPVPGRSRARNAGIAAARGSLVLLLDDDIRVAPDHLERRIEIHRQNPQAVVIGYIIDESPISPAFLRRYFLDRQTMGSSSVGKGTRELDYTQTRSGNMSVERVGLERIAETLPDGRKVYLDEELPRREDTYLGYLLHVAGYRFVFARDVVCYHQHPRDWANIRQASYEAGYSLYWLNKKVPELEGREKALIRSRWANYGLLAASATLLPLGLAIEPLTPWLMRKSTSGLLAGTANRGYQRAVREARQGAKPDQ
jgi:glycosyltransferase involved in cell wall biosynthesis